MPNLRKGSKGSSNPDSLDCDSGILNLGPTKLLSYRAPFSSTINLLVFADKTSE